jgi:hypothetical protein
MSIELKITADSQAELASIICRLATSFATTPAVANPMEVQEAQPEGDKPKVERRTRGPNKPKGEPEIDPVVAEDKREQIAARIAAVNTPAIEQTVFAPVDVKAPAKIEKSAVQKALIEVVRLHGPASVGALCKQYGGGNVSAFDTAENQQEIYAGLLAGAKVLMETPVKAA